MYIQIDDDTFLLYDSDTQVASTISKSSLEKQISDLQTNVPQIPSDDVLLAWAKENYPGISNINDTQVQISELQDQLDQMNNDQVDVSAQVTQLKKGGLTSA